MSEHRYVVWACSGFEKNVQKTLKERIAREGIESYFGQIFIPVEEVIDTKNGRKTISERKLYPGCVSVEIEIADSSQHLVKSILRVSGFIGGTANRPTLVSQRKTDVILQQVRSGVKKPKSKVEFEVGQQVCINEGPLVDFNGVVGEVDYERNKLRVSVQVFGRGTLAEPEFGQTEKI